MSDNGSKQIIDEINSKRTEDNQQDDSTKKTSTKRVKKIKIFNK